MSFTLKSIELKNIKAHEYLLFEPVLDGITAISGENGAGKSTVVDAFAWALYGIRPSGIRNKNFIKDDVNPREKPVSVKATILIGGIEYIVERKIITPEGTTECNVWGKKADTEDFAHVAGPAVSHVEKFIKNELGMNEKGFLTSILIQQKQVDQIVSASPRERGIVIEELTGISSITQAVQKTNENTRGLEKAASIFTIGNIDEAEEKVNKQQEVCDDIDKREKEAIEVFNDFKIVFTEQEANLAAQKIKVDKRINLTRDLETYKSQITFLKEQAETDLNFILDFRNKYGTTIFVNASASKVSVDKKRTELHGLTFELKNLNENLKNTLRDQNNCIELKGVFEDGKTANKELKILNKSLDTLEKELAIEHDKRSMMTSELKHSKSSHEHISGEKTNCPVCKSKITDPEHLKKEIEQDIDNFTKEKKSAEDKMLVIKEQITGIKESIKTVSIAIEAIKEYIKLDKIQSDLIKNISKLSQKEELAKADLEILEVEYNKVLRIEADKKALDAAKERSLTVNVKIDTNQEKLIKTTAQIKELDALPDRSYNALITQVKEAENKLTRMSISGKELRGRKKLELERLDDSKKNLKIVKDAMDKYNELAEQIKVSTSAAAMLNTFKADRIENSIPTLEFFASDFLSKFTGGAFTRMTIDEKFNTFVTTSTGTIRPIAQLSGGELSSAAIALRLGIAMLLNSSDKNVLILDEVLVSMDEDRSRQIMETIASMTNSQIIFIAHNTDINSIADKTVLISREESKEDI